MLSIAAIALAVIFAAAASWRLLPRVPSIAGQIANAAALLGAVAALVEWTLIKDSRWLIGSIMLGIGLALNLFVTSRRARISAVVLGDLALALFAIAYATGYRAL